MTAGSLRQGAINLLAPITVAATIVFWRVIPETWVRAPLTLTLAVAAVLLFIQALEFAFERHPGWRINRTEFLTDGFYLLLGFTLIDRCNDVFADGPLHAIKAHLHIATPAIAHLPFLVQVALVLTIIEFGQYWMHRAMHNWTPLWLTHAPHHHITQLNALKGAVGNPIELFLISLSVIALFDFATRPLLCAFTLLAVIPGYAHANVRSDPPIWYAWFFTTIRHHSLHHSVPYEATRCNYANSLILIDRIFGTFHEGEASVVGQDQRRRLSIAEQWAFPFVPLVNMWRRARQA